MLLSEPGRTNYDLNFSLLGFPVRVHPAFFIMPLLLGRGALEQGDNPGMVLVVLTAVFFGSILFHELGHSLALKFYGIGSHIVLYAMGGLAIPNGTRFGGRRSYDGKAQIIVSLAGPVFNFLLGGLMIGIIYLAGGHVLYAQAGLFPILDPVLEDTIFGANYAAWLFFKVGLFANVIWGVLNLVPVYPLDGGQIARELFKLNGGHNALRDSLYLSFGVALLLAAYGMMTQDYFLGILFGLLGYSNYQMIQHAGGIGRGW